jgi:2-polyprenyl-3-methyl-5-hydroxy-6-metoxy-1,4-benzoquinol methylase
VNIEEYVRMSDLESRHFWFIGRKNIIQSLLTQTMGQSRKEDLLILDAGCGTGGNLTWLSRLGQVVGIDFNEVACSLSAEKSGSVIRASLSDGIPFKDESFDLITLLDVLEHLEKDLETLRQLREKLKPGGRMLITVPAYRHLWCGHDVVHHHKRRYLKNQLHELLTASGLAIDYLSYYNTLLYPLVAMKRLLSRTTHTEPAGDLKLPSPIMNRLLSQIFSFEKHWIGKMNSPFGVSLVALVQRKIQ